MKKIKFINCYFGEWPVWFDGFLLSCKYNKNIDWLFFTDCKIPKNYPPNVKFVKCSMNYLSELATKKVKFKVKIKRPYKFCDLKPAYGLVFEDYLRNYDFWGMCDIDVIFGDIKKFVTDDMLDKYDVISSRKENIAGHFSLFRNNDEINNIFPSLPNCEFKINQDESQILDEADMDRYFKENKDRYKIYWDTYMLNFPSPDLCFFWDGPWYWSKGRLFVNSEEVMYLHFPKRIKDKFGVRRPAPWKKSIKSINFVYEDDVDSFYISSTSLEHTKVRKE